MIKNEIINLFIKYTNDISKANELWNEIEGAYSGNQRYYHTINHLNSIYSELIDHKEIISDWESILLSIAYHDFVYNVRETDNEEKSATYAKSILMQFSFPLDKVKLVSNHILATKNHFGNFDSDTNYFLDADLSILGVSWDQYLIYKDQIRKEYSIYSDDIYSEGRRKVLRKFLNMDRLFKTKEFSSKYEDIAKYNLNSELKILETAQK